jgi:hypothetical protein
MRARGDHGSERQFFFSGGKEKREFVVRAEKRSERERAERDLAFFLSPCVFLHPAPRGVGEFTVASLR